MHLRGLRLAGANSGDAVFWGKRYWLYRAADKTAVFEDAAWPQIDRSRCIVTTDPHRTVRLLDSKEGWPDPFRSDEYYAEAPRKVTTVLNKSALCAWQGSLVGSSQCVSLAYDASRGLVLSKHTWSDDNSLGSSFEVKATAAVQIPVALFNENTDWGVRGQDE